MGGRRGRMSCRELRVKLKWCSHLLHESVLGSFVI
jgi:hypothetical protein